MKTRYSMIGFALAALLLNACSNSDDPIGAGNPNPTPTSEWILLASDTSNNVTAFKPAASSPVQDPIPQLGQPLSLGSLALGEIHFAHGKAFVTVSTGLTGPAPDNLPSGGVVVVNPETQQVEDTVVLVSNQTTTGGGPAASRPVHVYLDPEAKYLWVNNDGPSGDTNPDSVFRVNVDPTDTDDTDAGGKYLDFVEIPIGNGHHKSAIPRPSTNQPNAMKLFISSSLSEARIDVIDDDPTHVATYGTVIKTIRNVGFVPHGFDYSPNSGRAFAGITGGGVVSIDANASALDPDSNGIDFPDVDCAGITDANCVATGTATVDPSVYKLTTGTGGNPSLFAGYVHVHSNEHGEDMVYTTGRDGGAATGFLTAIDPGAGATPPSAVTAIDLGDMAPSSFDAAGDKIYVPSGGDSVAVTDQVRVVDADHDSGTFNTIIKSITIGAHSGENRNGEVSPDGRLVVYPNTAGNTVSVIDTEDNDTVHTVALPANSRSVGIIHLPADGDENNH
jgi:hypothetical protein